MSIASYLIKPSFWTLLYTWLEREQFAAPYLMCEKQQKVNTTGGEDTYGFPMHDIYDLASCLI